MKTESKHDEIAPLSIGAKLRQAREKRGLSQQDIADHLCLRLVTISDIEADKNSAGLAVTFIRGYIRAYAKYVNLPEDELWDAADSSAAPIYKRDAKSGGVKGFPLNKSTTRKKRDSWLMLITWSILLVVVGLSGVWWWQNYKLDNKAIKTMAVNSAIELNKAHSEGRVIPLSNPDNGADVMVLPPPKPPQPLQTGSVDGRTPDSVVPFALFKHRQNLFPNLSAALTEEAIARLKVLANTVSMRFTDKSWVTITHRVNGRNVTLFSGQKNKGERLEVSGTPPYRITLGRPGAVSIEFGGKTIQPRARFTLSAAD